MPSEENPADDCSRGLSPSDPKWERFHKGPEFLWKGESEWPEQKYGKVVVMNALSTDKAKAKPEKFDWAVQIASRPELYSIFVNYTIPIQYFQVLGQYNTIPIQYNIH